MERCPFLSTQILGFSRKCRTVVITASKCCSVVIVASKCSTVVIVASKQHTVVIAACWRAGQRGHAGLTRCCNPPSRWQQPSSLSGTNSMLRGSFFIFLVPANFAGCLCVPSFLPADTAGCLCFHAGCVCVFLLPTDTAGVCLPFFLLTLPPVCLPFFLLAVSVSSCLPADTLVCFLFLTLLAGSCS